MPNYERIHSTIPVVEMDRARRFYRDTLGLKEVSPPQELDEDHVVFRVGDCSRFLLFKRPHRSKAEHTIAGLRVDDLEKSMGELEGRGVEFERYNLPDLKTDDRGIAEIGEWRGAWFKDTEGNILSLGEA